VVAVVGAIAVVGAFTAVCMVLGWDHDASTAVQVGGLVVAGVALTWYVAVTWLGAGKGASTGLRLGSQVYGDPRRRRAHQQEVAEVGWRKVNVAQCLEDFVGNRAWWLREPIFRLPVLIPIACSAGVFCVVDHDVGTSQFHQQALPLLVAILAAMVVINGFLAIRGQPIVDFITAVAALGVLLAGVLTSLTQVGRGDPATMTEAARRAAGVHHVQWVAATLVFGLVVLFMSLTRGVNTPGDPGVG
jgi:hypothetical protein